MHLFTFFDIKIFTIGIWHNKAKLRNGDKITTPLFLSLIFRECTLHFTAFVGILPWFFAL